MVDNGIVQKLMDLLDRHVEDGNVTVQHAALSALRNLAIPGKPPFALLPIQGEILLSRLCSFCTVIASSIFKYITDLSAILRHFESTVSSPTKERAGSQGFRKAERCFLFVFISFEFSFTAQGPHQTTVRNILKHCIPL